MTRWSFHILCVASTFLALLSQWRARAYLVNPWTAREWASGFFTNKCHPIPKNMTLCYGIGYDQMRLPNLLNHESVDEAVQQSNIWNLLDKTKCHDDLRIFLCSLYAPVCLKEARDRQIIKPCRSLCRVVRDNCLPRMRRFGYEWPAIARCDKFPDEKRNNLCIPPREQQRKTVVTCRACDQAITFENIISSFCMADVVLKGKMKSHRVDPSEYLFNIHKKRRYFRTLGLSSGEKRSIGGQLKRSNGCICPQLAKARRHDKWLIMGRRDRTTGRIDIVFLIAWQRRNRSFKKAARAIRKQSNICRRQQYSFMTNNEISLSQRPEARKRKNGGNRRRTQEVDDRFKYVDRPDNSRDNLQLLEGPTQWAPPRLNGRRNDLLARHMQDVRPLVRPRQLPPPGRQPDPSRQAPTIAQTPQRPSTVQRPTQTLTAPSKIPLRPLQPTPTHQQVPVLSQPAKQRPVSPTLPQPTRPNRRRGKGRRRKNRRKNRDGKKRDGKKRRKKQRGKKRKGKGRKRKDRKKEGKKAKGESQRERKRKRKRKKMRRNYMQQYYGVAVAR